MEKFIFILFILIFIILFVYKIIIGKSKKSYVKKELKKLPKNYLVINNISLKKKKKKCAIDHLVISPYGVFIIENKYYRNEVKGKEYDQNWILNPNKNKKYIYNPVYHNYGHALFLKEKFYLKESELFPIVCITSNNKIDVKSDKVVHVKQLIPLILSYREKIIPNYIELYNDIISEKVVKQEKVVTSNCPKCGGELVKRTSQYGSFMGCINYPKCKYIKK